MKETIVKINKTKSWVFEKINKMNKSLARLIKKKREKNQDNKIRNEKGEIATDNAEMQRIIRDYYEQLYDNNREGNAPHSSTLAWKIPWTEEPGRLQSMLRVGHD